MAVNRKFSSHIRKYSFASDETRKQIRSSDGSMVRTALRANSRNGINCRVINADNFASKSLCTGKPNEFKRLTFENMDFQLKTNLFTFVVLPVGSASIVSHCFCKRFRTLIPAFFRTTTASSSGGSSFIFNKLKRSVFFTNQQILNDIKRNAVLSKSAKFKPWPTALQ